jgi:bacteriocin-like protein
MTTDTMRELNIEELEAVSGGGSNCCGCFKNIHCPMDDGKKCLGPVNPPSK